MYYGFIRTYIFLQIPLQDSGRDLLQKKTS